MRKSLLKIMAKVFHTIMHHLYLNHWVVHGKRIVQQHQYMRGFYMAKKEEGVDRKSVV